ncbi:hypothetical protein I350_07492 [Cryptococcus amylolentus CBS 6273]|uniref:Uncharacterized protein n=1 Tax=Cryptococcus amylolentus CBS 6273 TaxID=1296118 RepID=A0A1E3JEQ5_9TREE|nr:hypothetical protein I350_07492 [Cryptococcus amylolentus CBS 6273]
MSEDEQAFSNPPSPLYLDSSPNDDPQQSEASTYSDPGSDVYGQEDLSKLEYHLDPESDIPLANQLRAMTTHLNTALQLHTDMSRQERRDFILSKVESSLSCAGIEGLEVDMKDEVEALAAGEVSAWWKKKNKKNEADVEAQKYLSWGHIFVHFLDPLGNAFEPSGVSTAAL